MLNDALLVRARSRLAQPAFAAAATRLRAEVRGDLSRPVLVPPPDRPAGYYHDYFCPQHGVQLEFDWSSPYAHRCPVDGAVFRGEPYDRCWWWFVNHAHSEAGFRLALGWRLDGQHACLDRLQAIFTAYAAHYPEAGWPKDDPRGRQGKVTFHALDEAVWLIPLAWAYHLARPALPADTRRDIEQRLLLPAAEHLLAQRWQQVHNYMCWLNAGVAAAATLVERQDLVRRVIDGPFGFHHQVRQGVLADGTWWEGSASYHYYTLAALLAMARSTQNVPAPQKASNVPGGAWPRSRATPLWRHPKVRRMFVAPLRWAYPDRSLPAINDCWYHSSLVGEVGHGIPPAAAFYEIAAGWYGDPAFGAILAANYSGGPGRPAAARDSVEALLYGPDSVAADEPRRRTSRLLTASANLPDFGIAVLRGPGVPPRERSGGRAALDQRTFLLMKYGPHGGGHGHPDKLGIVLFSHGERLSPDLGTPGYGIALNDTWYRHTLSHNTVLVDGQPQPPATGRLLSFRPLQRATGRAATGQSSAAAFGLIDAEVEWAAEAGVYTGVRLRRRILFRPTYFLDLFTVSCPAAHEIGWAYHNRGALTRFASAGQPAASAATPSGLAVPELLRLRAALAGDQDVMVSFALGDTGLDLWLGGLEGNGVTLATEAPSNPASEAMPLILRRCVAADATFVAVFHPHGARPAVRAVSWSRTPEALTCQVTTQRGAERWEMPAQADASLQLSVTSGDHR